MGRMFGHKKIQYKPFYKARKDKRLKVQCIFATEKSYGVHPIDGNLNLFYDQMHAFAQHIHAADKQHIYNLKKQGISTDPAPWVEPEKEGYTPTIRSLVNLNPDLNTVANLDEVSKETVEPQTDPDLGKMISKRQLQKKLTGMNGKLPATNN
jgi:hypothetical protein